MAYISSVLFQSRKYACATKASIFNNLKDVYLTYETTLFTITLVGKI